MKPLSTLAGAAAAAVLAGVLAPTCPAQEAALAQLAPVAKDLVAYFPFDEDANDVTGNLEPTFVNGATPVADRFGRPGSAYHFNGISDFMSVPHADVLQPTAGITVAAWILPESLPAVAAIVKKGSGNQVAEYFLHHGNGSGLPDPALGQVGDFYFRLDECPPNVCVPTYAASATQIQVGAWYHLVGTYDGAFVRLYVNGSLESEVWAPGTMGSNTDPLTIGGNAGPGYPYWFQGAIDEIRIYGRAITPREVNVLYRGKR